MKIIQYTIAKYLGLNTELTKAIATAHDIGHSLFGHQGERILSAISQRDLAKKFWHEKNGVDCVDKIEVLEDTHGDFQNLNLTYATRDIEDAITLGHFRRPSGRITSNYCRRNCTIFITLSSFSMISASFLAFLLYLVVGNLVARVSYELILVKLIICRNTTEINKKLDKKD